MRLIVAGAAGSVMPALGAAEAVARAMDADVLVVSIRPNHATRALRYDVLFVEQDRTEYVSDLLFWTLPDRMPALVPMARGAPAAIIGKTTLIPSDVIV